MTQLWFLFIVVKEPSTAFEKVNDSRSVDFTVNEKSTSCGEFHSENPVVDVAEPDLINKDRYSCTANPSPPSMSLLNIHVHVLDTFLNMVTMMLDSDITI